MKILIVDDSASCRLRLCKILNESPNDFYIFQAENGAEALSIIEKNRGLDIILSDINMPEMDGIALLKALRQRKDTEPLPFVIYSTECSEELKAIAKDFNASAWLLKPAKPETILMAINRISKSIMFLPEKS